MTDKLSTTARLRALDVMHGEIARAQPLYGLIGDIHVATGAALDAIAAIPTRPAGMTDRELREAVTLPPLKAAELIAAARELIEVFDNPRRQNAGEEIERLRRALP